MLVEDTEWSVYNDDRSARNAVNKMVSKLIAAVFARALSADAG
jgi:hypothetical protein